MSDRPVASVVVPVGRVDVELDEQLAALQAQRSEVAIEIVLALNAPGDDVEAELRTLADGQPGWPIRIVDASDRRGAAHARNVGAAEAAGELLLFCDGDDRVAPGWAATLIDRAGRGHAVGGHLDEELLAVPGQADWRPPATPDELPSFLDHPYLVSANCAVHRDDFLAVGGFDEQLTRCEDLAFSYALVEAGVELSYAAKAIVHYRHRAGLVPMLRQHFLYGRGMSELIARGMLPGSDGGLATRFRANSQPVDRWTTAQVLRKLSLGAGRLVGTATARGQ
ncbi:MAG: glycosyltransferase [Actinomycetota bacterium]